MIPLVVVVVIVVGVGGIVGVGVVVAVCVAVVAHNSVVDIVNFPSVAPAVGLYSLMLKKS